VSRSAFLTLTALALGLAAAPSCTTRRDERRAASDSLTALLAHLPAARPGVLWIEGMAESTTFLLFRGAERFALFYVPVDIVARASSGKEGTFVSFEFVAGANATSRTGPRAVTVATLFLSRLSDSLAVKPGALSLPFIRGAARDLRRHAWTEREYALAGTLPRHGPAVGELLFGRHSGLPFWIQVYYPVEMADGMGPRIEAILESWIWTDTGRPLVTERGGSI
jgi:hypothetical protein